MINAIVDYISSSTRTLGTAGASLVIGQISVFESTNVMLQRGAWTIAMIAGAMTVINLFFPLRSFYDNYKDRKKSKVQSD